jgi:hypothetical protein
MEWVTAIDNNIEMIKSLAIKESTGRNDATSTSTGVGDGGPNLRELQSTCNLPHRSLYYYKRLVESSMSEEEIRPYIEAFYDAVEAAGGF